MSMNYVFKEGLSGFKRTPLASLTAVIALMISLILIGVMARFYYSAFEIGTTIRNDIDIEVFLEDVNEERRRIIRTEIAAMPIVDQLTYISKDSAAAVFQELFGAQGSPIADLSFLPASYRIQPVPNTPADTLVFYLSKIAEIRGVDEISFNVELLKLIDERLQTVLFLGGGIGLLILFTAMILVFNTIRLTIYAKQSIIRAMKLVGATNGFIRRPFVMEGVLQGLIAGTVSCGIIMLFFSKILPFFVPQFGVIPWPFGRWYYLTGAIMALALLMGLLGSRWAARKFIKDASLS
ncbi:MAG: permease-like cell division protein FtsX [Balneolales bacterium]|nr:permease-like cell division protein FtsX [Balneolales bacterium]